MVPRRFPTYITKNAVSGWNKIHSSLDTLELQNI